MSNSASGITVSDWLKGAQIQFGKSPTASLDARLLLAHVLGWDVAKVLAYPETLLAPQQIQKLEKAYRLRKSGLPVAYVTGYKDFADFRVKVNEAVLIPRPETEAILTAAIEMATRTNAKEIYEVGTGSGVLSIGLARALPDVKIIASDISAKALAVAKQNIADYALESQITLVSSDLGTHIKHADLLVANLPYLPTGLKVSKDVKHEPDVALWSGKDGLDHYRKALAGISFESAVIEFGANQYQPLAKWLAHNLSGYQMSPIQNLDGSVCGGVITRD